MAARRSHARWLAPVALATCAIAVYAITRSGLEASSRERAGTTSTQPSRAGASSGDAGSATTTQPASATTATQAPRRYRIKAGDTLSAIAASTGVSVDELLERNPGLDAQSLQTGQIIKIAP